MSNKNKDFLKQKVNVVLSIPPEKVKKNITDNLHHIPTWFGDMFYPNGYEAIIVSAGPSMEKYVTELNIKERMENPQRNFVLFCVKHALPRLIAMGIEPDFCVILDGRTFDEKSTHNIERKSLFATIPDRTIFLVASMSDGGYANYLLSHGARVLGWHTSVTGLDEFRQSGAITEPVITGGTSSGTRAISLANAMGIRDMTLIGFDSCIFEPTEEQLNELDFKGRRKYLQTDLTVANPNDQFSPEEIEALNKVNMGLAAKGLVSRIGLGKKFWTTGELLAQAQDFEGILSNPEFDMKFKVFDDGLVRHMYDNMPSVPKRGYDFVSYMSNICPRVNPSKMPKRDVKVLKNRRKAAL